MSTQLRAVKNALLKSFEKTNALNNNIRHHKNILLGETVMALRDTIYMEFIGGGSKKFYEMTDLGNGKWRARWGRIGTAGQSMDYSMTKWYEKESEKTGKGYQIKRTVPNRGMPSSAPKPSPSSPAPAAIPQPNVPVKKDPEHEKRLQMVYDAIKNSKKNADSFDLNLLNSIRRNFAKTGILKQDDMVALNTIFKKYK